MSLLDGWSFARSSTAFENDAGGPLTLVGPSVPRITDLGCLIETERTNLFLWSQDLDDTSWAKVGVTIGADVTTAPDGTMTADKIIGNNTTGVLRIEKTITLAGATKYTLSGYAKALPGEARWFFIRPNVDNAHVVYFDAVDGVVGKVEPDWEGAWITPSVDGWYRFEATYTTVGTAYNFRIGPCNEGAVGATTVFTGNGVKGIYMWGLQIEAGAGATSYVPTGASPATRSADLATLEFVPADKGFIYVEFAGPVVQDDFVVDVIGADVGAPIAIDNGLVTTRNGATDLASGVTVARDQLVRAALTWGPAGRKIYANGVGSSDSGGVGAFTALSLGNASGNLNSFIRSMVMRNGMELSDALMAGVTDGSAVLPETTGPLYVQTVESTSGPEWALTAEFGGQSRVLLGQQGTIDYSPQAGVVRIVGANEGYAEFTRYQYGSTIRTAGPASSIFEFFIGDASADNCDLSVRHNGSGYGASIHARNAADTYSALLSATGSDRVRIGTDALASPPELSIQHVRTDGYTSFKVGVALDGTGGDELLRVGPEGLLLKALTAEPPDPPEGHSVEWLSDGTGAGDAGDRMMKITVGGVTKTATVVDFSALP